MRDERASLTGERAGLRGERVLIGQIRARTGRAARSGVSLGIGDDCALLRGRPGEELAVTTDLSLAGRHFRLDWHPPEAVGHRALARGLSDLAAMGARPVAALLSLGLPGELTRVARRVKTQTKTKPEGWSETWPGDWPGSGSGTWPGTWPGSWPGSWLDRFLDGLLALAGTHKTPLAGGDLAESPVALADVVLIGAVRRGRALLRSGARPGDLLYVTGSLGGAAAGLARLAQMAGAWGPAEPHPARRQPLRIPKKLDALLASHLYPQPRVAQGMWLARRGWATAAIDLSDGLSTDLKHLCEESGVAAEVDSAALPIAPFATQAQALHGGEDYELLFTASPSARVPRTIDGVPVTRIGRMIRRRSGRAQVMLVSAQGRQPLEARGWEHFV